MEDTKPKVKKKRCFVCNKKLLIEFTCKCNQCFCIKHQLPEQHICAYDFKKDFVSNEYKCEFTKVIKIT